MAERWPAIAAAKSVFGGKIAAVLRLAARKRGAGAWLVWLRT